MREGSQQSPTFAQRKEQGIHTPAHVNLQFNVDQIDCGSNNTGVLSTRGKFYAFGSNNCNQLGLECDADFSHEAFRITLPGDMPVAQFSFGQDYLLLLTQCKQVFGVGNNANG